MNLEEKQAAEAGAALEAETLNANWDDAELQEDDADDEQRDYIEKNLYDFYDIQLYAVVYIGSNK